MQTITIYMPLFADGTDVWRPVEAEPLANEVYRVVDVQNEDEAWAFPPGSTVRCERKIFSGGTEGLVAIAAAE